MVALETEFEKDDRVQILDPDGTEWLDAKYRRPASLPGEHVVALQQNGANSKRNDLMVVARNALRRGRS
jgi:hypothetical protein